MTDKEEYPDYLDIILNATNLLSNFTDWVEVYCDEGVNMEPLLAVFRPVVYILIFVLGVLGNGLMMAVLRRRRKSLRITEIYLLHLALVDLLLLFTFPFDLMETFVGWVCGRFLCKLVGALKSLSLYCGSFLLGYIGFDRYLAIVHAIPSLQTRLPRTVHLTCVLLWVGCFALAVPDLVFLNVIKPAMSESRFYCTYHGYGIHANNWTTAHTILGHICFFLPLAVMTYCYVAVVVTLCNRQRSKEKRVAIRLALLVTVVFCLCWLPHNIALLIGTLFDWQVITASNCSSVRHLQPATELTHSLGLSHCCLNPLLYAFVGVRFRKELIQLLCKLGCHVCLPFLRVKDHRLSSMTSSVVVKL